MCMCTMGVSAPSLHRESSDLIYVIYMYVDLEKDSSLEKLTFTRMVMQITYKIQIIQGVSEYGQIST